MSTHIGHVHAPSAPLGEAVAASGKFGLLKAIEHIRDRLRRRRQLQCLAELDDRLLADVGVTREQAMSAARRADWYLCIALRGEASQ